MRIESMLDGDGCGLKNTFRLCRQDLLGSIIDISTIVEQANFDENEYGEISFYVAKENNGYWDFHDRIFYDAKVQISLDLTEDIKAKWFVADRNISIIAKLNKCGFTPLIIGGQAENALSLEIYNAFLKAFPTTYELTRYSEARIEQLVGDFFNDSRKWINLYEAYMERRQRISMPSRVEENSTPREKRLVLAPDESNKYKRVEEYLSDKLESGITYHETGWQKEIEPILPLIFPKYIAVLPNVEIPIPLRHKIKPDIILVDYDGFLTVVELKTPTKYCLSGSLYRKNFTPSKEFSNSIVQIEKYIFALSRWGEDGEKILMENYRDQLSLLGKVHITNPKGMLIIGRSNEFDTQQRQDFEIIKKQYSNIVEILTYDDLIRRLRNLHEFYSSEA